MMEPRIFDDHAALNRWQVMQGMRVNEKGTMPSIYITEVKLKKVFSQLKPSELQAIFGKSISLSEVALKRHRDKVCKKLEQLSDEQILTALNIYLREEDAEVSAHYVMACSIDKHKKE